MTTILHIPDALGPWRTALADEEVEWARYQPFLEQRGYKLRPRYRPGWVPEMLRTGKKSWECEDAIPVWGPVLDATRISDGSQVVLKMLRMDSLELFLAQFLTEHPGADKHVIPVLEVVQLPADLDRAFMVMPRMRQSHDPAFKTVGEVGQFVLQVLEGMVYLHSKISHIGLDICPRNMVIDTSRMIPGGFNFARPWTSDGVVSLRGEKSGKPSIKTRTEAGPMKYYFIDFGLSVWFSSFETRRLVTGFFGQRGKYIPELSDTIPYDPFKVDVRLVGEMLRKDFLFVGVHLNPSVFSSLLVFARMYSDTQGWILSYRLYGNSAAMILRDGQMLLRPWHSSNGS
ncbi:hypothetical protein B0H19DRAFT_1256748 [Mycena capillaripes]|nr:hypothetical protein B0H19DRAFT_1256748 [Mycena capillaripes]